MLTFWLQDTGQANYLLEVKIHSYSNPSHTDVYGNCCDWNGCDSMCDTHFKYVHSTLQAILTEQLTVPWDCSHFAKMITLKDSTAPLSLMEYHGLKLLPIALCFCFFF